MLPDTTYQIFNRGIDSEILFKLKNNYSYFLQRMALYLSPVADLYAYCLMRDHFHLGLRTLSEVQIRENLKLDKNFNSLRSTSWLISNQFSSLFKSYSLSINNAFNRTGGLFEEPFRRMEIESQGDLRWLISYIHSNPSLHGITKEFEDYRFSSYSHLVSNDQTNLNRELVLATFGGLDNFELFHKLEIPPDVQDWLCLE